MSGFPYRLAPDTGTRLGLVVLSVDETVEGDLRALLPATAALHVTRVAAGAELTPETITAMGHDLTRAAALLPRVPFDGLAYACTSGTALLGAPAVAARLRAGAEARAVTDPLQAAVAAIGALGLRSVALVSPYIPEVALPIEAAFRDAGVTVAGALSFGERIEARVARIDRASLLAAGRQALEDTGAEGVFLSCTNLRTLEVIAPLEAETGRAVLSSNQVLAWHLARVAGIGAIAGPGRLFDTP